jgi:uncharacterized protein YwqG
MSDQQPDRIESGSTDIPDVLRMLAGVLPQFEGEDLESQLQTFDAFLDILSPSVRSQVAGLLIEAATKAPTSSARTRIEAAAESITQGGRAAAPYHHARAMQSYQESFRKDNPQPTLDPVPEPDESAQPVDSHEESPGSSADDPFRGKIKRRAIVMEIGGFRPLENPKASWFGKVAFGLPDEEWPRTDDDVAMVPLAQINLTELPFRPPHLDDLEFLTVFIDLDTLGGDENESTWCLRTYPHLNALVPLEAPEDLKSEIKALPMRPKIIEEDYPCHDDIPDDVSDDLVDSYEDDFENVSGFKLGGWPSLIQSQIYWPSHADASKPEYVFQIDSTEKGRWSWGDGGVGYFARGTTPGHKGEWFLTSQFY